MDYYTPVLAAQLATLEVLYILSHPAWDEHTTDRALFVKMMYGEWEGWDCFSDALDANPFWNEKKIEFRQKVMTERTLVPHIKDGDCTMDLTWKNVQTHDKLNSGRNIAQFHPF